MQLQLAPAGPGPSAACVGVHAAVHAERLFRVAETHPSPHCNLPGTMLNAMLWCSAWMRQTGGG